MEKMRKSSFMRKINWKTLEVSLLKIEKGYKLFVYIGTCIAFYSALLKRIVLCVVTTHMNIMHSQR